MGRLLEQLTIRANRLVRRMVAAPYLESRVRRPVPRRKPGEVWAFLVVRNEALRLPYVLRYHFERGVSRVVALDNQSADGTRDILESDERILMYSTRQPFKGNKIAWLELLLRRWGAGQWNLVLDADELFVHPHADRLSLPELAAFLDGQEVEALHCLFVEMFPRGRIGDANYGRDDDLLAAAPWFDAAGYERKRYQRVFGGAAPDSIFMGGTRARMFGGEFGCSKYPFFKYRRGQFLRLGLHTIEGARIAAEQGAVLHFKFLQDFKSKAAVEARRGMYWNAAAEYKAYAARLAQEGDLALWHPGARQYEGWRQLVELGLMRSSPALDAYAATKGGTS